LLASQIFDQATSYFDQFSVYYLGLTGSQFFFLVTKLMSEDLSTNETNSNREHVDAVVNTIKQLL